MAGNYANVPSWRMAWDRDGTQFFTMYSGLLAQQSSATMIAGNSEDGQTSICTGTSNGSNYGVWIFPELRDFDGVFIWDIGNPKLVTIEVSANTTNGLDGTWSNLGTYTTAGILGGPLPYYRTRITSMTALAIRGVRIYLPYQFNIAKIHFYGEISPAQNPNRLVLWHPTLNQRVTPSFFDWGDVPRSSSADKTFRVKNLSATLSANSIRVAQDVLTDATPSVPGQHTLSTDNVTFLPQVNIGTLAPGAISGALTLRRVTPVNAVLSVWAHRVFAEASTWS